MNVIGFNSLKLWRREKGRIFSIEHTC